MSLWPNTAMRLQNVSDDGDNDGVIRNGSGTYVWTRATVDSTRVRGAWTTGLRGTKGVPQGRGFEHPVDVRL